MKKTILKTSMLLALCAIVLCGCGVISARNLFKDKSSKEVSTSTPELTSVVAATPTPTIAPTPTPEPEVVVTEGYDELAKTGKITFEDFHITVPKEWVGKVYVIGMQDGFGIYQKASRDVDNSGYIMSFYRSDGPIATYAGERMKKYTPDHMYYVGYPTDVPYDYEDEEITEDYVNLAAKCDDALSSLSIDSDEVYTAEDMILPMAEFKEYDEEVIKYEEADTWQLAINEIYARHGNTFDNSYLQGYFNRCVWYTPKSTNVSYNDLNDFEKKNIDLLNDLLSDYQKVHPYPKQIMSDDVAHEVLNLSLGDENEISYQVEGDYSTGFNAVLKIDGVDYILGTFDVELESPNADFFFITDISEFDNTREVAIVDEGMDDNAITYFFTLDDHNVYCIGGVYGCPFIYGSHEKNGFNGYGQINSVSRSNLLTNQPITVPIWYDDSNYKFKDAPAEGLSDIVPNSLEIKTKKSITLRKDYWDEDSETFEVPSQTQIFFLGTDTTQNMQVKTKDGKIGILTVTDEMKSKPEEYFDFKN